MKIFVSSTSYDLDDFRLITIEELEKRNHEVIYHESPIFPVKLGLHSHDICLETIKDVDLVLCIIKSRYGGLYRGNTPEQFKDINIEINGMTKKGNKKKQNISIKKDKLSITWCELYIAYEYKIPVITFVKKTTADEKETRRRNQFLASFQPAHVDDTKLFEFIDWITKKRINNWIVTYNNIIDYKKYLIKWISEIENNSIGPVKNHLLNNDLEAQVNNIIENNLLINTNNLIKNKNIMPVLIFVEGETDRKYLAYLITKLKLNSEYRFVVTYGKYRMLKETSEYIISYNTENVLFILDYDNDDDERKAFDNMFHEIKLSHKRMVFAEPNLDEWIKIGYNENVNNRNIKKMDFEIEYDLEKALSKSISLKKLVEILKEFG